MSFLNGILNRLTSQSHSVDVLSNKPHANHGVKIGYAKINGEKIEIKTTQWDNIYQLGNCGKFTLSAEVIAHRSSDGEMLIGHHYLESLSRMYQEWKNDNLQLMRGISSNHFSWNGIVLDEKVVSEGTNEFPGATMGGSASCWVPTSIASDEHALQTSTSIALGNHNSTMYECINAAHPQENVLLGMVLTFHAGENKSLPVHFLNAGEILLKGPVEKKHFEISHLVISKPSDPTGFQALSYSGESWDKDLMPAALYDPNDTYADSGKEMTRDWMAKSAVKVSSLINPMDKITSADL
ncbi:hypothetical protein QNN88_10300 [Citrobacter sp. ANG330]|uniref:hypothetical protein n=1 Tax=Citrobacter sp. ANG330 TaxID=3048142 RepID=UPI0039C28BE7